MRAHYTIVVRERRNCWEINCDCNPGRCPFSRSEVKWAGAVKLVDDLAGESPASANCPVGTVVTSGGGAGDQTVGSPDVNALEGRTHVWSVLTGGKQSSRS